jgi:hypothetical protein
MLSIGAPAARGIFLGTFHMDWRDRPWVKWLPQVLVLAVVAAFSAVILWSRAQPPCKRSEQRSVEAPDSKYSRDGIRSYEVCIER